MVSYRNGSFIIMGELSPFSFGHIVNLQAFTNREEELQKLKKKPNQRCKYHYHFTEKMGKILIGCQGHCRNQQRRAQLQNRKNRPVFG